MAKTFTTLRMGMLSSVASVALIAGGVAIGALPTASAAVLTVGAEPAAAALPNGGLTPFAAAAAVNTCAGTTTSVSKTDGTMQVDRTENSIVLYSQFDDDFAPTGKSALLGDLKFSFTISDDAQPGDQYTFIADGAATYRGTPSKTATSDSTIVQNASGQTIATVQRAGSELRFTYTDFVTASRGETVNYSITYGYFVPYPFTPGESYPASFHGCEADGTKMAWNENISDEDIAFSTGFGATATSGNTAMNYSYNARPVSTPGNPVTVIISNDQPGFGIVCSDFGDEKLLSLRAVGANRWDDDKQTITARPSYRRVDGDPQPGEYQIVDCDARSVTIKWNPADANDGFALYETAIPDGDTRWQSLGTNKPFTWTATYEVAGQTTPAQGSPSKPPMNIASGGGGGEIKIIDPEITKSALVDGKYTLTVRNTSTNQNELVEEGNWADAFYIDGQLQKPLTIRATGSLGSVDTSTQVWHTPRLLPGESATAEVTFDPNTLVPGAVAVNRFGKAGDACVEGELDDAELGTLCVQAPPVTGAMGSMSWSKVDGDSKGLLAGSEWSLTGPNGFSESVVDNGTNDADTTAGQLKVSDLPLGTYTLRETKAPQGYLSPTFSTQVTVAAEQRDVVLDPVTNTAIAPKVELSKTSNPPSGVSVAPGMEVTYTVTARNTGNVDLASVTLTDDLSDVLDNSVRQQLLADPVASVGEAPTLNAGTGVLSWSGPLAKGESVTLTYSVNIAANFVAGETLTNRVSGQLVAQGGDPAQPVAVPPCGEGCTTSQTPFVLPKAPTVTALPDLSMPPLPVLPTEPTVTALPDLTIPPTLPETTESTPLPSETAPGAPTPSETAPGSPTPSDKAPGSPLPSETAPATQLATPGQSSGNGTGNGAGLTPTGDKTGSQQGGSQGTGLAHTGADGFGILLAASILLVGAAGTVLLVQGRRRSS